LRISRSLTERIRESVQKEPDGIAARQENCWSIWTGGESRAKAGGGAGIGCETVTSEDNPHGPRGSSFQGSDISLLKPRPFWRAAQWKFLGRHRRLAAENPLPERALNFRHKCAPLVGQKLDGAGLILEQF
jgi:hypothetical protein